MRLQANRIMCVTAAGWLVFLLTSGIGRAGEDSPLVAIAAEQNRTAEVQALLKRGADMRLPQPDGMTALHWAVYHDNEELTELLIDSGCDVNSVTRYGVAPLSIACLNGHARIVELLLSRGADAKTTLPGGETALMTASRTGRPGPVQALLENGADVKAREQKGQTAIMWAAAAGNVEVVDALLNAGADFQTPLDSGFTPLFFAVREGRTKAALRLLQAGLDVDAAMQRPRAARNGPNPLILAVNNGHFETALALVDAGADPNAQPTGFAALHAVSSVRKPLRGDGDPPPAGSGNAASLNFVRELVARGADINIQLVRGSSGFADFTTTGASPFLLAARTGDLPLLNLLLQLGADPTITNADNSTAILAAAGIGDLGSGLESAGTEKEAIETVRLLLELGLDVNAVDKNGETAMHGAAYQNWPRVVEFLAQNGADVKIWNQKNRWEWTPLMIAHGYRKGNFRPDAATIAAIRSAMLDAGIAPPTLGPGILANQQSWDKKKPEPGIDAKTKKNTSKEEKAETNPANPSPNQPP